MTPLGMLDTLDAALADARERRLRGHDVALRTYGPKHVLGVTGEAVDGDDGRRVVLFTVRQVRRMRKTLLGALREEAQDPSLPL